MGRLLHFRTHSGLLARFTCESSAIKEKLSCEPSLSYNRKIIRFFIQVFSFFTLLRVVLEIVLTKICPHLLKIFRGISGGPSKIGEFMGFLKTGRCSVEQAHFTVNSLSKTVNPFS